MSQRSAKPHQSHHNGERMLQIFRSNASHYIKLTVTILRPASNYICQNRQLNDIRNVLTHSTFPTQFHNKCVSNVTGMNHRKRYRHSAAPPVQVQRCHNELGESLPNTRNNTLISVNSTNPCIMKFEIPTEGNTLPLATCCSPAPPPPQRYRYHLTETLPQLSQDRKISKKNQTSNSLIKS